MNLNISWLGAGDWVHKVRERRLARHEKASHGRKPRTPPTVVQDKLDENSARFRAAKEARTRRLEAAITEHVALSKFLRVLHDEEPKFKAPIAGVLDADIGELALHFGLDHLPVPVKFLAVEELSSTVRRVNKREHGHEHDEIPWCLPVGVRFTMSEFKEAVRMT